MQWRNVWWIRQGAPKRLLLLGGVTFPFKQLYVSILCLLQKQKMAPNLTLQLKEQVFFAPFFPPCFSENGVFAQCYFHGFLFICALSLVIFHFRDFLKIANAKIKRVRKKPVLQ